MTDAEPTDAVCYVATVSHLFQTLVSAGQARANLDPCRTVLIVALVDDTDDELLLRSFDEACVQVGVILLQLSRRSLIGGHHPMLARLFLDQALPRGLKRLLYLDGDTQILGNLDPLFDSFDATLGPRSFAASPDPMVYLRCTRGALGRHIERIWATSRVPPEMQHAYVNSGVLLLRRDDIPELRTKCLGLLDNELADVPFTDQTAINLSGFKCVPLSTRWNFPGFLLRTAVSHLVKPRIVHFMSNPRPWDGRYPRWGYAFFAPYAAAARSTPSIGAEWRRLPVLIRFLQACKQLAAMCLSDRYFRDSVVLRSVQEVESRAVL